MSSISPADQPDKSGLTPNQRLMIDNGIVLGANIAGIALGMVGLPGSGPVLAGFGTMLFQFVAPGKSPQEAYYEALSAQIAAMETAVLDDLSLISQQIVGLETELSLVEQELALDIELSSYNTSKSTINVYYQEMVSIFQAIASKSDLAENATNLYALLQNNADNVAIQMRVLHDTLLDNDSTSG
jgi:hypothetical protein